MQSLWLQDRDGLWVESGILGLGVKHGGEAQESCTHHLLVMDIGMGCLC